MAIEHPVKCSTCGQLLEGIYQTRHAACPECGGVDRTYMVTLEDSATAGNAFPVEGTYNADNEWWHQDHKLFWHLENLRTIYRTGRPEGNSGPLQIELDAFFIACWHMRDWIANDSYNLPWVNLTVIDRFVETNVPLKRARAYANTIKHLELDKPHKLRMRKVGFESTESSMSISLEFWSSVDPPEQIDALELAEQCFAAWDTFKVQQQI